MTRAPAGTLCVATIASPLGDLRVAADGVALRLVEYDGLERTDRQLRRVCRRLSAEMSGDEDASVASLVDELRRYFAGELTDFQTPAVPVGTQFQQRVWAELRRIPCGETRSYAQIARAIGKPAAVRAVGAANGANPISILVPCHRVVNTGGELGGYGGGLERKRWLLEHEQRLSGATLFR